MLSEDRVYHDGRKEAKHNLYVYQPDSNTIGCRVNEKGCLEFIMDGKNHGVVWSKPLPMDRPLWGFVDLPIEYKIQACFTYGECIDTYIQLKVTLAKHMRQYRHWIRTTLCRSGSSSSI